jgi:ADP-heptose:LPS heptosyltransferase
LHALPKDCFEYICLQKEVKPVDQEVLDSNLEIRFFGSELLDFSDTAALIDCVDLVISTCTSVPHLAAALGKKTYLLISYNPDWRWMLERYDSPWYSSITLFRQQLNGDWGTVLDQLKTRLLDKDQP